MMLSDAEREEIEKLIRSPKYASSNRTRDKLRTRMKKKGLIHFDRKKWEWVVLVELKETKS